MTDGRALRKAKAGRRLDGGAGPDHFINVESSRRRLEAQRTGQRFPIYGAALGKFRRVMGEVAAAQASGSVLPDILASVFDD